MAMGRPPKPVERKRALGNPGKRPLPATTDVSILPGAGDAPLPLRPLGASGLAMWERIWTRAIQWLSPDCDIELIQMMCESADERGALRVKVLRDGSNSDRRALRTLDDQIMKGLSALGFTPTDRSRLGLAEVKRESKLDELKRKRAGR